MTWQLLNVQLWYYINWCTYVIGQHSTMWPTCVAILTKTSLQSLFKLDIKNEITHLLPCIIPPFSFCVIVDANVCILWLKSVLCVEDVKHILRVTDPNCECALVVAQLGQRFSIPLVTAMRWWNITNRRRTIFSPKDTTHRLRLAIHCCSITCYMYIHVFLQPLKLFNLENLYLLMNNWGE